MPARSGTAGAIARAGAPLTHALTLRAVLRARAQALPCDVTVFQVPLTALASYLQSVTVFENGISLTLAKYSRADKLKVIYGHLDMHYNFNGMNHHGYIPKASKGVPLVESNTEIIASYSPHPPLRNLDFRGRRSFLAHSRTSGRFLNPGPASR